MGVPLLILLIGPTATLSVAVANVVVTLALGPATIFLLELGGRLVTSAKVDYRTVLRAMKNSLMTSCALV